MCNTAITVLICFVFFHSPSFCGYTPFANTFAASVASCFCSFGIIAISCIEIIDIAIVFQYVFTIYSYSFFLYLFERSTLNNQCCLLAVFNTVFPISVRSKIYYKYTHNGPSFCRVRLSFLFVSIL